MHSRLGDEGPEGGHKGRGRHLAFDQKALHPAGGGVDQVGGCQQTRRRGGRRGGGPVGGSHPAVHWQRQYNQTMTVLQQGATS